MKARKLFPQQASVNIQIHTCIMHMPAMDIFIRCQNCAPTNVDRGVHACAKSQTSQTLHAQPNHNNCEERLPACSSNLRIASQCVRWMTLRTGDHTHNGTRALTNAAMDEQLQPEIALCKLHGNAIGTHIEMISSHRTTANGVIMCIVRKCIFNDVWLNTILEQRGPTNSNRASRESLQHMLAHNGNRRRGIATTRIPRTSDKIWLFRTVSLCSFTCVW